MIGVPQFLVPGIIQADALFIGDLARVSPLCVAVLLQFYVGPVAVPDGTVPVYAGRKDAQPLQPDRYTPAVKVQDRLDDLYQRNLDHSPG